MCLSMWAVIHAAKKSSLLTVFYNTVKLHGGLVFSLHWHDPWKMLVWLGQLCKGTAMPCTNLEALSMQKLWAQEALYGDTCWVASYSQSWCHHFSWSLLTCLKCLVMVCQARPVSHWAYEMIYLHQHSPYWVAYDQHVHSSSTHHKRPDDHVPLPLHQQSHHPEWFVCGYVGAAIIQSVLTAYVYHAHEMCNTHISIMAKVEPWCSTNLTYVSDRWLGWFRLQSCSTRNNMSVSWLKWLPTNLASNVPYTPLLESFKTKPVAGNCTTSHAMLRKGLPTHQITQLIPCLWGWGLLLAGSASSQSQGHHPLLHKI